MLGTAVGLSGFRGALRNVFFTAGVSLFLIASCGESANEEPLPGGDGVPNGGSKPMGGSGGTGARGGSNATGGMGAEGGEPTTDPLAPVVTIVSPEALEHPSGGTVLVGPEVEVRCRAVQSRDRNSSAVLPGSVTIEMLDAEGERVGEPITGSPTTRDNEYFATFFVQNLPNGVVSFKCSASDEAEPPHSATTTLSTLFDGGPAITVREPLEDSVHAQRGVVRFELLVEAAPVAENDDEAAVDSVVLEVASQEFPLEDDGDGVYFADVDFTDPIFGSTGLSGSTPVQIWATNSRSDPGPVTRDYSYDFVVDAEGPTITIASPENATVRGGEVELDFTVVDPTPGSGVDEDSVTVTINLEAHNYSLNDRAWTPETGGRFRFTFDSRTIEGSQAQATITVDARDNARNTARTASMTLFLDNKPPIVDLDPPNIRERRNSMPPLCSLPFDPLGLSPKNDVSVVNRGLPRPRVLVWDETNEVEGLAPHPSWTNRDTVYLYLQGDPSVPMLTDGSDADDVCDTIDPAAVRVQLTALNQQGSSWFGPVTEDTTPTDPPLVACGYGTATNPPPFLCNNQLSDLRRVIPHGLVSSEPVVYAFGSLVEPLCTGDGWEIGGFIKDRNGEAREGWICLVAEAEDNAGNRSLSAPLRLCYDDADTPAQPSCMNLADPPSCRQACSVRRFADLPLDERVITTGQ
jgi:hypothetical protein